MLDRLTIERMAAWTGGKPILIALSGGGDSVALLRLLAAELGAPRLRAAIVDHALREGSAEDAARARSFADALRVGAEVLTLSWGKEANRAQQAAREARYRAICDYARAEGLNTIAAAHTADDQAETVLMRAASSSTWRGLAGMAPFAFAPLWPEGRGIALARPLLGARREELRAYLRDASAAWIDDPANRNLLYERTRARTLLSDLESGGVDVMRLARLAAHMRARAEQLDLEARALIDRAAVFEEKRILVRFDAWVGPDAVRQRALAVLMSAAAGASREPSSSQLPAVERRIRAPEHRGSTHSGVRFVPRSGGVSLEREAAALWGRDGRPRAPLLTPLVPGVETIWDGRFAVTASVSGWRLERSGADLALDRRSRVDASTSWPVVRPLARDRVRHALAPEIPRANP